MKYVPNVSVSVLTSAVRVTSAPGAGVAKVYCQAPEPSVYIQTTHKPAQSKFFPKQAYLLS